MKIVAGKVVDGKVLITIDLAALESQLIVRDPPRAVTVKAVMEAAARYYGLSVTSLRNTQRTRGFVRARRVAMFLARKLVRASLIEIGNSFAKDHTTVLASLVAAEADKDLRHDISQIESWLKDHGRTQL